MKQHQRAIAFTSILFVALVVAVLEWRSVENRSELASGVSTPLPAHTQPLPSSASVATPAPPVASTRPAPPVASTRPAPPASTPPTPPVASTPPAASQATAPPPTGSPAPVAQPPEPEMAAPDAPPKILSASLTPSVAQAGQMVSGTVITSSNVASVEARIGGYAAELTKVAAGQFHLNYTVPNLPPLLRRTYAVDVIARNTRGDRTSTQTSITIH